MANYCVYCGAALPPEAQLCPRCGRLVPEVEAPSAAPLTREASAPEEPAVPAPPLEEAPPVPAQAGEKALPDAPAPDAPALDAPALDAPAQPGGDPPEEAVAPAAQTPPAHQPPEETPPPVPQPPKEAPPAPPAPRPTAPKYAPVGMPQASASAARPQPAPGFPVPRPDLLTTGGVLGLVLLGLIPLVGWIVLLVWAFDSASGPNHRALAKGLLLAKLICGVLCVLWVLFLFFLMDMIPPYYLY